MAKKTFIKGFCNHFDREILVAGRQWNRCNQFQALQWLKIDHGCWIASKIQRSILSRVRGCIPSNCVSSTFNYVFFFNILRVQIIFLWTVLWVHYFEYIKFHIFVDETKVWWLLLTKEFNYDKHFLPGIQNGEFVILLVIIL